MSEAAKALRELVARMSAGTGRVGWFEHLVSTMNRGANEIESLTAALDSAIQRAEEAEKVHQRMMDSMSAEALELKASLADKEGELAEEKKDAAMLSKWLNETKEKLSEYRNENRSLADELESLRERLRPRKWPDEKPDKAYQFVAVQLRRYDNEYDDILSWNDDGEDEENWNEFGVITWFPIIPTESPDTGGEL